MALKGEILVFESHVKKIEHAWKHLVGAQNDDIMHFIGIVIE